MSTIAYVVAVIFMVFLPLIFSFTLVRKYGTPWMVFMMGGLAFLVAEIVRSVAGNAINSSDFYNNLMHGLSMDYFVYIIFLNALIMSVFQTAARYAGFRLAGPSGLTWGGGLTVAAGFAALTLVLNYGLNAVMTPVFVMTAPTTLPDGMTPADFASMQDMVNTYWNATFLNAFVQSNLIPGLWQFTLQFALTMVVWVGVVQKKWQWIASAFLLEVAMFSVYFVVGNWIAFYLFNAQDYLINLILGSLIFVALMAFNVGIVYFIYKKVSPLTPAVVEVKAKPAPSKPAQNTLAPREKSVQDAKAARKIKNTDLK